MPAATSPFAPLRHRTFLSFWSVYLLSSIGSQAQAVAAAWTMTTLTRAPAQISMITTATALPMLFFAVPAGVISDIFDRRKVLLAAQALMLLGSLLLAVMTLAGLTTPWILVGCVFTIGCGFTLNAPSWQASVRELVEPADLPGAIALNSMAFNVGRMSGPAIGGIVVGSVGAAAAFIANTISYLAPIAVLAAWRRTRPVRPGPREPFGSAVVTGIRYAVNMPPVRAILWRDIVYGIASAGVLSLLPLIGVERMGGALGYGMLLSALGIGSISGGLSVAPLRLRLGAGGMARLAIGASTAATAGLALAEQPWQCCAAMFAVGWSTVALLSMFNVAIQFSVPAWVVGRILSLHQMALFGGLAIGSVLWGQVASIAETRIAIGGAAIVSGVLLLASLRLQIRLTVDTGLEEVPPVALDPGLNQADLGSPLIVAIHYRVAIQDTAQFLDAMTRCGQLRRRDGARHWTLLRASDDPETWIEQFRSDDWASHLRYRTRRTREYEHIHALVRAMQIDGKPPEARYFTQPGRSPAPSRAIDELTL